MDINISVSGDAEDIFNFAEQINGKLSDALLAGAESVADTAREMCPVDTGILKDSISVASSGNSAEVSVGADYGIFVEFGTYKNPAQPFLAPSLDSTDVFSAIIGGLEL